MDDFLKQKAWKVCLSSSPSDICWDKVTREETKFSFPTTLWKQRKRLPFNDYYEEWEEKERKKRKKIKNVKHAVKTNKSIQEDEKLAIYVGINNRRAKCPFPSTFPSFLRSPDLVVFFLRFARSVSRRWPTAKTRKHDALAKDTPTNDFRHDRVEIRTRERRAKRTALRTCCFPSGKCAFAPSQTRLSKIIVIINPRRMIHFSRDR